MSLDFSAILKDFNGEELAEMGRDGKPFLVTLKRVSINALQSMTASENLDGVEKMTRFLVAKKIAKDQPLVADDLAKLKECVLQYLHPVYCSAALALLESDSA